jgi:hypothetical protein
MSRLSIDRLSIGLPVVQQKIELNEILRLVNQFLEQFGNGEYLPSIDKDENLEQESLTDLFIASVTKSAKPGIKL